MSDSHSQLYVKENNLLQLSLFYFDKTRPVPMQTKAEWVDDAGKSHKLECICKYGVPGSFEQDVYTATMRIWVKQGMPEGGVTLNYSDIARELGLNPNFWASKIKASLMKLGQARYEFTQCFIMADSSKQEDLIHFSLYDTAQLFEYTKGRSKRQSRSTLVFSEKIRMNLEAKYYQRLDFSWYRALPDGLPRRLYEYLDKRRYHGVNGVFSIGEQWICLWLPIHDQNTTNRRKRLERIAGELIKAGYLKKYEFDVDRKLCRFTYANPGPPLQEMEAVEVQGRVVDSPTRAPAQTPPEATRRTPSITWGEVLVVQEWLESIPYMHKRKIKAIASLPVDQVTAVYPAIRAEYERQAADGQSPRSAWIYEQFRKHIDAPESAPVAHRQAEQQTLFDEQQEPLPIDCLNQVILKILDPEVAEKTIRQEAQKENALRKEHLKTLCGLLKKKTTQITQAVESYYDQKCLDYVLWNIRYANENARSNYSTYLQKALKENWAEEWKEEEQKNQEIEIQERKAKREAAEKEDSQEREKAMFVELHDRLDREIKENLAQQAQAEESPQSRNSTMPARIRYVELVREHFRKQGRIISREATGLLAFIKQVTSDIF